MVVADFDRTVPLAVVQALRFVSSGETKPLKFQADDLIDRQTLRGVCELTAESAARLDALLPPLQPLHLAERRVLLLALPGVFVKRKGDHLINEKGTSLVNPSKL